MTQRIVLVSGCIRGQLWSSQRREDIAAITTAMARLKRDKEYTDATIVAPYLLYAEVASDVSSIRLGGEAGYDLVPHTEVLALGDELYPDMRAELLRAMNLGLFVQGESLVMRGHIANLRFKSCLFKQRSAA